MAGSYNTTAYNTTAYNEDSAFVGLTFSGAVVTIRQQVQQTVATQAVVELHQKVGFIASSQAVVTLEQVVNLRYVYTTQAVVTITNTVNETASSQAVTTFIQRVVDTPTANGFYEKYGWDCEVILGSLHITTDLVAKQYGLHGQMKIEASENGSRSAIFTVIPPESTIDPNSFQGNSVIINIRKNDGIWYRAFTGYVDIPELDFLQRKIKFRCTDRRADRIIALGDSFVSQIGSYSEDVFGKAQDKSDELDKRLETTTSTVDFDSYGNPRFITWRAKSTADISLGNSDVFYSDVNVSYTNRAKTINRVNLTLNYTYERLHQQTVRFTWQEYTPDTDGLYDWFTTGKGSFPGKETIRSAASQGDWAMQNLQFTDLWEAQVIAIGDGFGEWKPDTVYEDTKGREEFLGYLKDNMGNYVTAGNPAKLVPIYEPVLDANGNQIQDVIRKVIIDSSSHLCIGASWNSFRRFTQTITESYNIQITAPQLISKFGAIDSYDSIDIQDKYDASWWENSKLSSTASENFYIDAASERIRYSQAMQVILNRARTKLLKVSRDVTVSFRTKFIQPNIDLYHTIQIDIDDKLSSDSGDPHLTAKGKCGAFTNVLDFDSTEAYTDVTLYLSKADGITTDTTQFSILNPSQDPSYIGSRPTIALDTHLGIDPNPANTPNADKWVGYIGNALVGNDAEGYQRTNYPESFIVEFPEIPNYLRDRKVYTSEAVDNTFTILIPNDTLDVSF